MKILVGLSGGVDSAVSAYLLKKEGYDIACGFMINYLDEDSPDTCPTRSDLEEAKTVARYLGLPFYTFDYREEYEKRIIQYIYEEYALGRTPNPDVFCNNLIKFDLFLEEAISLGYDMIATGHYVKKINNRLYKGVDPSKDQSYFLSRLSEYQIEKSIFPIGDMQKKEVREIAASIGLPNAKRKDSQGLCFIGKINMKEFLERRIPKKEGDILDIHHNIIGKHEGAHSYTLGQRRGIKIGGGEPLFVIAKDIANNTITVGTSREIRLFSPLCRINNWIGDIPKENKEYGVKIRYRQEDQAGHIICEGNGVFRVEFLRPQRAITPGQICVIYEDSRVVGSGIIIENSPLH